MSEQKQAQKRFVILISGRGSNMQAIVNMAKKRDDIHIAAVISHKPNSVGLVWAKEQGIETAELLHKSYPTRESYDEALRDLVLSYQADYVILAGFMRILTEVFIEPFKGRLINIHPSLLPSFTGLDTHERAIVEGVKVHGCTVHFVTPVLDVGPIIAQAIVPVHKKDDADTLAARVLTMEHQVYPAVVDYLAQDLLSLHNQQVEYKKPVTTLFVHPDIG
ncbi:phosphoribosylglycinamide formyltransferase [Pelistega sp. NLN82]|uniref:Phosphoribosylglycinamide formyltransferase n=1 Tax=Pelistega ratti TaxID=2652177 RepID=A0A6L9Y7K1_9BURK|nr:phosphoribosylglycinamide formyltransferase [Pelistega ratti]NEN76371.1 phosphoribosylglycinamide formyltransferase [Pelistega ratti]